MLPVECPDRARRKLSEEKKKIFDLLVSRGYKYLGEGRNRLGFRSPNGRWVVKLARDEDGEMDNQTEATRWAEKNTKFKSTGKEYDVPIARCRIVNNELMVMEFVKREEDPYSLDIDWACKIDCGQVGYTRKRKLVAYDFASD